VTEDLTWRRIICQPFVWLWKSGTRLRNHKTVRVGLEFVDLSETEGAIIRVIEKLARSRLVKRCGLIAWVNDARCT
jgi:hypothetical protein